MLYLRYLKALIVNNPAKIIFILLTVIPFFLFMKEKNVYVDKKNYLVNKFEFENHPYLNLGKFQLFNEYGIDFFGSKYDSSKIDKIDEHESEIERLESKIDDLKGQLEEQ